MLDHTRKIALDVDVDRFLFYKNFIDQNDAWPSNDFNKLIQTEGNLGIKMKYAFQKVFESHKKVIIIGSDCASLNAQIIHQAYLALDAHSFVIGPAIDGGYYLLGMNEYLPQVFEDIEWSTLNVFSKTIEIIDNLGKSYYLLPKLSDIDTEEDWLKYGWEI